MSACSCERSGSRASPPRPSSDGPAALLNARASAGVSGSQNDACDPAADTPAPAGAAATATTVETSATAPASFPILI